MKRNSRSILQEINNIDAERDRNHVIEGRASNIIHGGYDEVEAVDLHNRLVNSIRHKDPKRFIRGIRKIQESKK